jgi:hydroxymethylbilane synthase
MPEADRRLRIGTRASRLALWQTQAVMDALHARRPGLLVERVPISTIGDRITDVPLPRIGDKGVFTRELEDGLREATIDLAVHSLKDLPTEQPHGLALGAVLERDDPRDALVASSPDRPWRAWPPGSRVGTSSLRRQGTAPRGTPGSRHPRFTRQRADEGRHGPPRGPRTPRCSRWPGSSGSI